MLRGLLMAVAALAVLFAAYLALFLLIHALGGTAGEDFGDAVVRSAGSATGSGLVLLLLPRARPRGDAQRGGWGSRLRRGARSPRAGQ
jgi:uncharacterized membrane protein YccC